MSRTTVNLLLDTILLLLTLALAWSSCILKFVFPPATRAGGWVLWGMDYDGWSTFQAGLLGILLLAVVIHLMLHWNWVCSAIASRVLRRGGKVDDGIQTLYGVATLIGCVLVTTGLLVLADLMIRSPTHR